MFEMLNNKETTMTNLAILRQITKLLRSKSETFNIDMGTVKLHGVIITVRDGYVRMYYPSRSLVYSVNFVSAERWYKKYTVMCSRLQHADALMRSKTKNQLYGKNPNVTEVSGLL